MPTSADGESVLLDGDDDLVSAQKMQATLACRATFLGIKVFSVLGLRTRGHKLFVESLNASEFEAVNFTEMMIYEDNMNDETDAMYDNDRHNQIVTGKIY